MCRLSRIYPDIYECECGCGGMINNNHIELIRFITGHSSRGERNHKWRHDKPFDPNLYKLTVEENSP